MSKRVKHLLLCGMTLPQWVELIIKPHLNDSICSMNNLRLVSIFFGRSTELKNIIYNVSKNNTLRRLRWIRDMLNERKEFAIDHTENGQYYVTYMSYSYSTLYYTKCDRHLVLVEVRQITIPIASKIILKLIRDNHDIAIKTIYENQQQRQSFNIRWEVQHVPNKAPNAPLRGNVASFKRSSDLNSTLTPQERIKQYSHFRKERGYWDLDSVIDAVPDFSLPLNNDLI